MMEDASSVKTRQLPRESQKSLKGKMTGKIDLPHRTFLSHLESSGVIPLVSEILHQFIIGKGTLQNISTCLVCPVVFFHQQHFWKHSDVVLSQSPTSTYFSKIPAFEENKSSSSSVCGQRSKKHSKISHDVF